MGEYEPKIEVNFPLTVTAARGVTVKLECFALGNPVPTISWRKVNGNIPSKARLRKSQAVLEIPNVQLDDSGTYECKAENSRGKNIFRGQLQVYTYPQWIRMINDTQLDSGEQLHWDCKATGKPRPSYRWLWNGAPLLSRNRTEMVNGELLIKSLRQSDAGMYQCVAENKHGAIYSSAELKILASAPSFQPIPERKIVTVIAGKDIVLECKPQASPKPDITWKKGDRRIPPNKRISVVEDNSLRIVNSTKSDEGSYVCRGENQFGSAEMTTTVRVKEPTRMQLAPSRMEVTVGESVVLNCKAFHDPSLDVSFLWLQNREPINFHKEGGHFENIGAPVSEEFQNGEGFGYIVAFRANGTRGWKEKMVTSADASKFIYRDETVPPLTPFEVKVGVYNNKGDGPFSNIVTVYSAEGEPREAPSDVKAASVSSSEIIVVWRPPNPAPGRPKNYEVNYWKDMEQEESGERMKTPGNETTILLTGLEGNTLYHITVKGYNSAGQGPASTAVRAKTKKSPPSQAPGNLMGIQDGDRVSLGWEAVKPLDNESDVMGYKVLFRQEGQSSSEVIETNISSAVVPLSGGGIYIIEVRAFSEGGEGTASSQIRVPVSSGVRVPNHQRSMHSISTCSVTVTILLVFVIPSASW
ncbi:contactin-5-like [Polyodon spathula]|uniref:contactin-5-like n=1 Tax=Polyodon spathula TaxID=7913 RepID=UPI001B7D9BC7|nr:contactin-5-like [Polyodon spathula]